MSYPQYEDDLQRIHESEVYGIAVFETVAKMTRDPERKQKWLALKALEEKTLNRYLEYMRTTGQDVREPRGWRLKGVAEGMALGFLPWRFAMKLLYSGTKPFQEKFLRLKEHATGSEKAFFTYVYAHEKAIEAFAKKELLRESDSLIAVENLLALERRKI